jgi:hypothetical protein
MTMPAPTPPASRAFERMGTSLKQQFLLLQAKRDGNLARFWPCERRKTPTAHMKSWKVSMPAFRRFRKREHESSEIIIGHADLSHHWPASITRYTLAQPMPSALAMA